MNNSLKFMNFQIGSIVSDEANIWTGFQRTLRSGSDLRNSLNLQIS